MRSPADEATRWLIHAQDEYQDAEELRKRERFYLALFHFQQAAEKALKAFLYAHIDDRRVFFTHSVLELIQAVVDLDPDLADLEKAGRLDQYYIPTRYPNGLPGGVPSRFYNDPKEAAEASSLAHQVLQAVARRLEK
jgi:HEPN domain-containing protein